VLILASVSGLAACELIAEVDREKIPGDTIPDSGVAGTDGGDAAQPDVVADQVSEAKPDTGPDAEAGADAKLDADADAPAASCTDGKQNGTETGIDCGGAACPACDNGKGCAADADCKSLNCDTAASPPVCKAGECDNQKKDGDETDVDCGGATCPNRCAVEQQCQVGTDCADGVCDEQATPKVCLLHTCTDTVQNGDETDVDCGGSCAPNSQCADTEKCVADTDCQSGFCNESVTPSICESAECNDGVLNGSETAVDCGGTCKACADGQACMVAADCTSVNYGQVDGGLQCIPATCTDTIQNQGETDEDCGGATPPGCDRCADGKKCEASSDCLAGHPCAPGTKLCVECLADTDCALGKLCDLTTNTCSVDGCVDGVHGCPSPEACCVGVCSNVTADPTNCGGCGQVCSGNNIDVPACAAGVCSGNCNTGFGDCDSDKLTNGCEVSTATDVTHCGTCTTVCSVANGTPACLVGQCAIGTCNNGFADCTGGYGDGCETDTATSPAHCGACNAACNLANATSGCAASTCTLVSCDSGFDNCNTTIADGCEVNLNTTVEHCGQCDRGCSDTNTAALSCAAGLCNSTCSAGFSNCTQPAAPATDNGCELPTATDPANCGACGNICPNPANATGACTNSACTFTCTAGFSDCTASPGCETNTATSAAHCGACNHACGSNGTCADSVCVCGNAGACAPGQVCTNPNTCGNP
jgi:hypothetical protein